MGGRSTLDSPGGGAGREAPRLPRTPDPGAAEAPVTRSRNLLPTGLARSGPSPRGTHTHRGSHLRRARTRPCLPPHWVHTLHCTLTHCWPARLHLHIRATYTLGPRVTSRLLCTGAPQHPPWKYSHPLSCIPEEPRTLGTRVPRHTSHTHPPFDTFPHTMTQAHPLHSLAEELGARSHSQTLWLTLLLSHTHLFCVTDTDTQTALQTRARSHTIAHTHTSRCT